VNELTIMLSGIRTFYLENNQIKNVYILSQIKRPYLYGKYIILLINNYLSTPYMITDDKFDKRSDIPISTMYSRSFGSSP